MSLAAAEIYTNFYGDGLKPDPVLTVSEWADKYRVLTSVSSAETGPWKTSRTPYSKEIMDNLSATAPYTEIVFMKGAQIGATELGNNWIGYVIDQAPGPMMSVVPNLDTARKNSKIRIAPMIESCPSLRDKVSDAKSRDSGNTTLQKDFPGGTLIMGGANSAVSLRSTAIRYLYLDEEDGYVMDSGGEGDPVSLAKKRTDTFSSRKKIFHTSTPTIADRSRIEANFNLTDQRYYFMPCPDCGHMQRLDWQNMHWEKGQPDTVYYECEECKYRIRNWQKTQMLAKGEWRATSKSKYKKLIGYHLSGLYSPVGWLDWEECVRNWEEANNPRNLEKLKTFINTVLGESWKDKSEAPEWKKLYLRRDDYKMNTLPNGVCFLTAGVDVQKGRLEVEIVGWGRDKRSWSIDYRVYDGNTDSIDSDPYRDLAQLLGEMWETASGADVMIERMAIDSGYNTQTVYSWVRSMKTRRVIAVKGSDTTPILVGAGRPVDVKQGNKKIRRALKMFLIGVSILKSEVYGWLKLEQPTENEQDPYGYCRFPQYDEQHFKRLTSETFETKWVNGKKKRGWIENGRNEQLDCRNYARAAASLFGMDRFKKSKWDTLESETGVVSKRQSDENMPSLKKKRVKTRIKRRKTTFMR